MRQKSCEHQLQRNTCTVCMGTLMAAQAKQGSPVKLEEPKQKPVKLCPHNNIRNLCRDCRRALFCEHGRQKNQCKDCGGTSICQHQRIRSRCKECGGASICKHNRERSGCKDCGGGSRCEHGRMRVQCKDCMGASICVHRRRKATCKDCGGVSICEHNRVRHRCKDCGGVSICEHKRQRAFCKECKGSGICEHNRQRHRCKECGGASICEHNDHRHRCKQCKAKKLAAQAEGVAQAEGGTKAVKKKESVRPVRKNSASPSASTSVRNKCREGGEASLDVGAMQPVKKEEKRGRHLLKIPARLSVTICEHNRVRHECSECGLASVVAVPVTAVGSMQSVSVKQEDTGSTSFGDGGVVGVGVGGKSRQELERESYERERRAARRREQGARSEMGEERGAWSEKRKRKEASQPCLGGVEDGISRAGRRLRREAAATAQSEGSGENGASSNRGEERGAGMAVSEEGGAGKDEPEPTAGAGEKIALLEFMLNIVGNRPAQS